MVFFEPKDRMKKVFCKFQLLKNKYLIISLTYAFTLLFLTRYFIEAYIRYSFMNLPVGWDTPEYVYKINMAKNGFFFEVIQRCYFTNFVYPIIFSLLPVDSFLVEKFVPIFISFLTPIAAYIFTVKTSKYNGALVIFLVSAWFAIYRLSSDLHANLLALTICLCIFSLILSPFTLTKKQMSFIFWIAWIASFIHLETTVFFSVIALITLITLRDRLKDFGDRVAILIASIIPACLLYAYSKYSKLQTVGILATGSGIIYGDTFVNSFGIYLLPFVIAGILFLILKKEKNNFDVFILDWATLCFLMIFLHFFFPIRNFAERALVIFPSPFLLVPLIDFMLKKTFSNKNEIKLSKIFLISLVIAIIVSANSLVEFSLEYYPKVFISRDIYENLTYLENELRNNATNEIFIYNLDSSAIVELYDNWVSATVGNHLSYYGNFYDLLQMKIGDKYDNLISRRFYNNLKNQCPNISKCQVIFLKQFYTDESILNYINAEELDNSNIYICDLTKLMAQTNITIAIEDLDLSSLGHWYTNEKLGALEIYYNETQDPYLLLYADFLSEGYYNLSLTYWDGSLGSGLKIFVNNELMNIVNYTGSATFRSFLVRNVFFHADTNLIKIQVFKQHIYKYFARLKSITISPNPFKF